MNKVEVKVIHTPILELFPGDWLNLVVVVERLPELGNNEQFLTLYEAVLDCASNTLTSLNFIAVV